jgi:SAM-dependent methyltransferase
MEVAHELLGSGKREAAPEVISCTSCGGSEHLTTLYSLTDIPVQSTVLVNNEQAARDFPRGDLVLKWCGQCGLVFNAAFDPSRVSYSVDYEDAQGSSPTFNEFATQISRKWISRYGLAGGHVVEIGCGKGDFLRLMCAEGGCSGTGYDPSFVRREARPGPDVSFHAEFFTDAHVPVNADFIVCRHTLEHVGAVAEFLGLIRRACGTNERIRLGFEVPDLRRILQEGAFWDIYYEHASYFTAGSLARAFLFAGFDILDVRRAYGDQYLLLDAAPVAETRRGLPALADDLEETALLVEQFRRRAGQQIQDYRTDFEGWKRDARRVAIWGSGSKAVGFLTTIGDPGIVNCVVDINAARDGRYMPGCRMPIVSPRELCGFRPDVVIIMNPIYRQEIGRDLGAMGLSPEIRVLSGAPATEGVQ